MSLKYVRKFLSLTSGMYKGRPSVSGDGGDGGSRAWMKTDKPEGVE